MPFYGKSFTFNGLSCRDFDLMMYDIDNKRSDTNRVVNGISIIEDYSKLRWKPFFYGTSMDKKLSFDIVFGVNIDRIDSNQYLSRLEIHNIAHWLTGHDSYKFLEIEQDDMQYIRYKCIITSLEVMEYDMLPYAMKATVECDSPFAYMYPQTFKYNVEGRKNVQIYNDSGYNGYYYPIVSIAMNNTYYPTSDSVFLPWKKYYVEYGNEYILSDVSPGEPVPQSMYYYERGNFSIINNTDNARVSYFHDIPQSVSNINVDNDKCIITCDDSINIYPHFNCKFFRLMSGNNSIDIYGNGTISFICEFPVYVGG